MKQLNATFITSAEKLSQCPDIVMPEFPLLGRSNVGKSSFINALCNNKKLAKTSNTPGKTRLINYFNFADKFLIADLPGYGYAKVSQEAQAKWQKYLEEYLLNRKQIKSLIQFIDARHDVQKNDLQMREWIDTYKLPVFTILTKIDYIPKSKRAKKLADTQKILQGDIFMFSAEDKQYCENVIEYLINLCQ